MAPLKLQFILPVGTFEVELARRVIDDALYGSLTVGDVYGATRHAEYRIQTEHRHNALGQCWARSSWKQLYRVVASARVRA